MASCFKINAFTCCSREHNFKTWPSAPCPINFTDSKLMRKSIGLSTDQRGFSNHNVKFCVRAKASICVGGEKTLKPNMIEIHSTQQLVDILSNAGDRLVIVDFYSPACGGCKALHPKICQLAESNSDAIFLKVNYEQHKKMCHSLHIHVLPFFRFYRGAQGKVCSFSCTNATIKKFKDAVAKYGTDPPCASPAKGLDESELMRLTSLGEISFNLPILPTSEEHRMEDLVLSA